MIPTPYIPYLTELKSILLPEPVFCESARCLSQSCGNILIHTEHPMQFYDEASYCSDECMEEQENNDYYGEDEDEFSEYIDSVLDNDYDW